MRETLRKLDLKITELADYLKVSRPTMYKYIDAFESGNNSDISPNVLRLFKYIEKNEGLISKRNVVNFVLTNTVEEEPKTSNGKDVVSKLAELINKKGEDSPKVKLIKKIVFSDEYDKLIPYLLEINPLIKQEHLTPEDEEKLKPIFEIYSLKGISKKNNGGNNNV
jgi:predicted transcriptional regulator